MLEILAIVILIALMSIGYVYVLYRKVAKIKVANQKAGEISDYIREGALAFLKREYMVIIPFVIIVAILLAVLGFIPGIQNAEGVGWQAAICFVVGSLFSALAGFIGMLAATKANVRTAVSAEKEGMSSALNVAFSGGAILGITVAGIGLFGLTALFLLFSEILPGGMHDAIGVVTGYGLGCSMIALFGRVGGGIYTKAADVGADLVGKVEAGIPEDDPRNPAVIADNVGDNVGDIAGMGSDLAESFVGAIISCLTMASIGIAEGKFNMDDKYILFPIMICAIGIISSILSVAFVRMRKWKHPHVALNIATYVASIIVLIGTLFLSIFYLKEWKAFLAVFAGLIVGIAVGFIAEIYTSADYKCVKNIARESQTGHATNIISGFGSGMQSTGLTVALVVVGIAIAYLVMGDKGEYGIALAAVGMLSTIGITVSVDGYGPISDNAGGIAQMSGMDKSVREITDKLDSVGNTTAAVGKGFSICSATLTSLALVVSYMSLTGVKSIDLANPVFVIGLLIGAMLPYLFSSLTIAAVGRAANKMIEEVRGQFKKDKGILEGTSKPDYAKCVDISTKAALREMILPGVLAVAAPIAGGFILGSEGLAGILLGGLASSVMLAIFMANSGGAWDNAKKYVEEGHFGGKGSETHKAAVTGDTVGDPLKDTAGPSMNILIKLMSIIALIIGPVLANVESLWEYIVRILN